MSLSLSPALVEFVTERHLSTLVTLRADGSPHAVPVGFTIADGVVRVITRAGSVKVRHAQRGGRALVSQVDGRRWVTFEGAARVVTEPDAVAAAEAAYAKRYRVPEPRADRVVLEIVVDRVLCSKGLRE
jgi:PPOX class probable F420-dependent enzyme